VNPEPASAKAGPSVAGAIFVGVFVWIVFDNLALGLIFGLIVAGSVATRTRKGSAAEPQPPDADTTA